MEFQRYFNDYEIETQIYGDIDINVLKASHQKTRKQVILKIQNTPVKKQQKVEFYVKEFEIHQHAWKLSPQDIIQLYEQKTFQEKDKIYHAIIMEYAEHGDLFTEIDARADHQSFWAERTLWTYFKQLINVFAKFEENNIAHRDIKPANILVCKNKNKPKKLKITDFGVATYTNLKPPQSPVGTFCYAPPELQSQWKKKKFQHEVYKSDVYSLGVVFLSMASLLLVDRFIDDDINAVNSIFQKLKERGQYSDQIIDLIQLMIHDDKSVRADFIELQNLVGQMSNKTPKSALIYEKLKPVKRKEQGYSIYSAISAIKPLKKRKIDVERSEQKENEWDPSKQYF